MHSLGSTFSDKETSGRSAGARARGDSRAAGPKRADHRLVPARRRAVHRHALFPGTQDLLGGRRVRAGALGAGDPIWRSPWCAWCGPIGAACPAGRLAVSVVFDMGLLMTLIWSFHLQYAQPPSFYLKAPDPAMGVHLHRATRLALRLALRRAWPAWSPRSCGRPWWSTWSSSTRPT